jgi:hypothetical protein
MKPALTGATADMKFPSESESRARLKGKTDALKTDPPSNKKVVEVLDHASAALKQDDQRDPVVRHTAQLVDATKKIAIKKNKGEHLQKAFKASSMAAKDYKEGSPEYEQLKTMTHSHLRSVPQLTRDLFFALLTDPDFRTNVSDLLDHIVILFQSDPEEELSIPDGYHVDSSKPITTATAVNPTSSQVTTTTTQVIPIEKDHTVHKHHRQEGHHEHSKAHEWKEPNYTPLSPALQERMRQTWNNMLLRFAQNPRWSRLLQDIFDLIDVIKSEHHASLKKTRHGLAAPSGETTATLSEKMKDENPQATEAAGHLKSFVANFVDDESLANLIKRLHHLSRDVRTDANLRRWLGRLRSYVNLVMRNPNRDMETEKMRNRGTKLFNDGHRVLATSRFRTHIVQLSRDWKEVIQQIGHDKELNAFTKALRKLKDDVTIAKADGSIQLDFNALIEMRGVLLSVLLSMLKEVTLPTYEGEQGHYKFKLSGMKLAVDDILPSQITILHETSANLVVPQMDPHTSTVHTSKTHATKTFNDPHDSTTTSSSSRVAGVKHVSPNKPWLMGKLIVRAENIVTSFRNCHFWYQHTTFPKTQDSGEAIMDITGRGMNVEIEFLMENDGHGGMFFSKGVVWVSMDKFKLTLTNANHSAFYALFKKAINKKVGDLVLNHIAQNIADSTGAIATGLNELIAKASPQQFLSSFLTTVDNVVPPMRS